MKKLFLLAGLLLTTAVSAQADQSPMMGGEDLPIEVISQFVADGPLVAIPTGGTATVAIVDNSGLKDCKRGTGAECTASVDEVAE
jgi:hypothetical protein